MKVITFYSYKGGVGRTLAASNFAVYLAKLGLKTVVIDFDLEAPGIDAKFGLPELLRHTIRISRSSMQVQNSRFDKQYGLYLLF
jgi:MinD-like ATPase involved in chromosome partitioning or flagellar assembly